jgi:glutamyl-tRNA reductase
MPRVNPNLMSAQQSLIIKSNIPEIKRICQKKGIDYEVQSPRKPKVKISQQELKEAYQKLAKSKNYEKEMKE